MLLDVGCGDGALVRSLAGHIRHATGIEPSLDAPVSGDGYELLPGRFPDDLPTSGGFDAITMLAVVEHLPPEALAHLGHSFGRLLKPAGRVIITVPSPRVDDVLHVLMRLHLIAGIGAHEHHGFDPSLVPQLLPMPQFRLLEYSRFQLGLNNLFVFEKTTAGADG